MKFSIEEGGPDQSTNRSVVFRPYEHSFDTVPSIPEGWNRSIGLGYVQLWVDAEGFIRTLTGYVGTRYLNASITLPRSECGGVRIIEGLAPYSLSEVNIDEWSLEIDTSNSIARYGTKEQDARMIQVCEHLVVGLGSYDQIKCVYWLFTTSEEQY